MPTIKVRKYKDSVYIIYSHKDKQFKIFTGVKVEDKYWKVSAPKKNCPSYKNVVTQITEMESRVLNASIKIRSLGNEPTVERVRSEFYAQIKPAHKEQPFWEAYAEYLRVKPFKPSTKRKVEIFKKTLEFYCSWSGYKMDIETWDRLNFERFIQYLIKHQKMADSTIQRLIKGLKTFMKFAYPLKNLSWMKYTLVTRDEEIVALSEEELKYLINAKLTGYQGTARDLFVFLATTGMRFSDSQLFDPTWITEDQVLDFNQLKTGGKAYPPLYEASRRVLIKYDGIPPHISNQKFNKYLKKLFKELNMSRPITTHIIRGKVVYRKVAPLYTVISSHTARRTFITLCLQKGMPLQDVMRMSGHSDFKSMKPYMRVTLKHIRSVANKWRI